MARRTTPQKTSQKTSQKQPDALEAAPFELLEPTPAKAPRRARKAAARAPESMEPAETEALFPSGDDEAPAAALPAKPRRGRRAKADNTPDAREEAEAAPLADTMPVADTEQPDMLAGAAQAEPPPEPPPADLPAPTMPAAEGGDAAEAAVSVNAETGAVVFDWPGIERVAAAEGPNRAMARLLLAARAEGASSRWPFSPR